MPRTVLLREWLEKHFSHHSTDQDFVCEPASAEASFRLYFRVTLPDGSTRIVMDAPPEHEDCRPFLKVAALFREAGVHVPEVYAEDLAQGFLLLSDLGNTTYLDALNDHSAPRLYGDANAALIDIQRTSRPGILPEYDRALLSRELELFPEWYIQRHLGITLTEIQNATLRGIFAAILANNLAQPQVFVHRDYHSRNLMLIESDYPTNPGIIDFQDAVYGPITYDLASLYRDAYIDWEEKDELDWVIRYWEKARQAGLPVHADFHDFYRDYEWMGAQRQIKVLGIFSRLCHRDGKDGYLNDMPRVMAYLRRTCERYLELRPLARLLDQLENRSTDVGYTF
jgi:aminoglycoside/choline kinase family phosphotransferase